MEKTIPILIGSIIVVFLLIIGVVTFAVLKSDVDDEETPPIIQEGEGEEDVEDNEEYELPPVVRSSGQIMLGVEYAVPGLASKFGELGVVSVKYLPDLYTWDKMQLSQEAEVDYRTLDRYVLEYQEAGFLELVISLKTKSKWASKHFEKNHAPRPEYVADFEAWVNGIVERYDGDGVDDMPGLKRAVNYYEIGVEFSSFEPEPADQYIEMLEVAYNAAHNSFEGVKVAHAAFLTTNAFDDNPGSDKYEEAFADVDRSIMYHSLSDIRAVLDRPEIFDLVNVHSVGSVYEIEPMMQWLRYEMGQRGYNKKIIISDSAITPFIAWGPASVCEGRNLGQIIKPAVEDDRCVIAEHFTKLIANDQNETRWTHKFVAEDVVKRAIIAAEQDVSLINLAFMEDLNLLKSPILKAGAGNSAWGGMTLTFTNILDQQRTIKEIRPSFYALKQLQSHLSGYKNIERLDLQDSSVRVYKISKPGGDVIVAWYDPGKLVLQNTFVSGKGGVSIPVSGEVVVEEAITKFGQSVASNETLIVNGGSVQVDLGTTPIYIY
tara:strand:+ start:3252 stop:4889 length:1638 start_codon:yes stop_codon:yes gene_type:complete